MAPLEVEQLVAHVDAHVAQVRGRLLRHTPHLEAAPEVDGGDVGQLGGEIERHARDTCPHLRVGAGPDVGVQRPDDQAVPGRRLLHVLQVFVPDPEARRGPSRVGAVGGAAAQPRVHAHRQLPPGRGSREQLELVERAGIEEHASRQVLREASRGHLRRELDGVGSEARAQRPLHLVVARGVDVQPEVAEQREDPAARVGLHGVAQREAERGREGERPPGRRFQRGAIVDVARGAEALAHLGGLLGRQERRPAEPGRGLHRGPSFLTTHSSAGRRGGATGAPATPARA